MKIKSLIATLSIISAAASMTACSNMKGNPQEAPVTEEAATPSSETEVATPEDDSKIAELKALVDQDIRSNTVLSSMTEMSEVYSDQHCGSEELTKIGKTRIQINENGAIVTKKAQDTIRENVTDQQQIEASIKAIAVKLKDQSNYACTIRVSAQIAKITKENEFKNYNGDSDSHEDYKQHVERKSIVAEGLEDVFNTAMRVFHKPNEAAQSFSSSIEQLKTTIADLNLQQDSLRNQIQQCDESCDGISGFASVFLTRLATESRDFQAFIDSGLETPEIGPSAQEAAKLASSATALSQLASQWIEDLENAQTR